MAKGGRYARKKSHGGLLAVILILLSLALVLAAVLFLKKPQAVPEETAAAPTTTAEPATVPSTAEAPVTVPPTTEAPTEPDTTPPVIEGAQDRKVFIGDTVAYRTGVTVTDDRDPAPWLDVDSSAVDLSQAGEYPLIYTAADSAGNTASVTVTITVAVKPKNYVEPEVIYEKADEILAKIITEDMTTEEQVWAVYKYVHRYITYYGKSDRTDYVQTAYHALKTQGADCYGFFAASKLLLERLGIPTIDVQKVRNFPQDSDHFWSLVSIDGGETWYHYDSTPWTDMGREVCLVTDAELDEMSRNHEGCYNRDKDLYPPTPEK